MADTKQGESFFRRVVRFVANPATDWNELASRQDDNRELELEKSEIKAMIERKRRNDFVRKREFDMLRKVRREGLSPEQVAALGNSSKLDDSDSRHDGQAVRPDGVKAKIDAIEQQMVGDQGFSAAVNTPRRPAAGPASRPAPQPPAPPPDDHEVAGRVVDDDGPLPPLPPLPFTDSEIGAPPPPAPSRTTARAAPAPVQLGSGLPPLASAMSPSTSRGPAPSAAPTPSGAGTTKASTPKAAPAPKASPTARAPAAASSAAGLRPMGPLDTVSPNGLEVSEVAHDPELDEPVIAFANADFASAETALQGLTGPGGARLGHAETWLVLFDLYRATGQQLRFESLALDYAQRFGWSAPQWFSLPQLVAEAVAEDRPRNAHRIGGEVSWMCPAHLDTEGVGRLRAQTLQTPMPWVLDWKELVTVDAEAAMQLSTLFRVWASEPLQMRWVGGERLFSALREAAPTGVRDADPVFWLTRLDGLRLANRPDQFDEAAIDYCVTYEVSPPSWEPARCQVHVSDNVHSSRMPSQMPAEVSTSFMESKLMDEGDREVAHVELSGQLVGDIGATLTQLGDQLGQASSINVSCARLIRVDFIAAGDLLNWVIGTTQKGRTVVFTDAHRLVALFFGAMGISEHAKVQLRRV
jgi:hypothetical protein